MRSCTLPVRVYYEDTDAGGVVYHTGYIRYFERARTEWLRALGYSQAKLAEEVGVLFTVVELTVRFLKPARLDDLLTVSASAEAGGGASLQFDQQVRDETGALLAEGRVRVACVDARTLKPRRLPADLAARIAA
nr:MAG: tol-pal system-associated acyl-CoA thioesterase [Pseudomonadota bacterium]